MPSRAPCHKRALFLRQALQRGHKVVVVVNKIDRPAARSDEVVNETFDLFVDLGANDEQADFPVVYARALEGRAGLDPDALADDLKPLFDAIVNHLPPPQVAVKRFNTAFGHHLRAQRICRKIAVGRLSSGSLRTGQAIVHIDAEGEMTPASVGQVCVCAT